MRRKSVIGWLIVCSGALLLGGNAVASVAPSGDPPMLVKDGVEVLGAEFGLFNPPEPGKPLFVPTNRVPLIPDQAYGWVVTIRTNHEQVHWREEFTLPAEPRSWGDPDENGTQHVSLDHRTSVMEADAPIESGLISNQWAVVPGDPMGRYVIRVYVEGKLVRTFEFDVR